MRGHDEAPQERDPNLDGVIETITRNYRPADSVETATLRLTTTEVFELVRQHYPAATYTSVEVYVALKEFGYQSADVYGDLVQRWLLQRLA